jgi:hypothetical protein
MKVSRFAAVLFVIVALTSLTVVAGLAAPAPQKGGPGDPPVVSDLTIIVGSETHHDTSLPLRDIVPLPATGGKGEVEGNENPKIFGLQDLEQHTDPVVQDRFVLDAMPSPTLTFDGIPYPGVSCNCAPPDPNSDVGPNHIVETVNTAFQVFSKTGTSLYGPASINTIWSGFGGNCQTSNDGDPIVLYDSLADRWLISQFTASSPYDECIAISQTSDPTGAWYRYAFQLTTSDFPDYPHLGVWPDGYYMSSQQGFPGNSLNAVVFDRANMLNGNAGTPQVRQIAGPAITFLPSDLDGAPPPLGTPNYFARQIDSAYYNVGGNDRVEVWEFHVDWANPAGTTFTQTRSLNTVPFEELLCGAASPDLGQRCVPQPNSAQLLDTITPWPMFRLQYLSSPEHDSLVFNHTVNSGGGVAGIRWYELRADVPGSGVWEIFQQGTFAPQPDPAIRSQPEYRWMGSVAMDRAGNLALGYSVSSQNLIANGDDINGFPSVRYTGRFVGDPLGQLRPDEVTVVQGSGAVVQGFWTDPGRWGDYSAMAVDPVDNCTFWYTQEYLPADGLWLTRIASFRFPNCKKH